MILESRRYEMDEWNNVVMPAVESGKITQDATPPSFLVMAQQFRGVLVEDERRFYCSGWSKPPCYVIVQEMPARCPTCGEPMSHGGTRETLVGYISPAGHDHDDNCQSRVYTCKNGHTMHVSKRRRCSVPGCDWVGKETCFCHRDPKVDKWPEEG